MAAAGGHVEVLRLLLEAGADVNLADDSSVTALMMAADRGHVEVLRLLLGGRCRRKPGRQQRARRH